MLGFTLPPPCDDMLFEAELEPTRAALNKLKMTTEVGEGELITFGGKVNRVAVGYPYCENLISRYTEQAKEIPHEIKKMMDRYDFHFVSLNCSFLPDTDCRFVWARFGIELSARSESRELQERPIAHDMLPDQVLTEMKCKRKVSFNSGLKLSLGVVKTDTGIDVETEKEITVYKPQIIAFGINMPTVAWDFKSTEEKGIWGNKRDLILIVRAPKKSTIMGRFLLGAEVEYYIGKWIPMPLSKKKGDLVDKEYNLSKVSVRK